MTVIAAATAAIPKAFLFIIVPQHAAQTNFRAARRDCEPEQLPESVRVL
jgi:hypothetical protein